MTILDLDRLTHARAEDLARLLHFMGERAPRRRRGEYVTFYRNRLALAVATQLARSS